MWTLRNALHQAGRDLHQWRRDGPSPQHCLRAWFFAAKLQAHTRAIRKDCRRKKTEKVAEAIQADNVYQAARRFAPNTPKRRIQLRRVDGGLQTHEAEFRQIVQHFKTLYDAEPTEPPPLSEDLHIEGRDCLGYEPASTKQGHAHSKCLLLPKPGKALKIAVGTGGQDPGFCAGQPSESPGQGVPHVAPTVRLC